MLYLDYPAYDFRSRELNGTRQVFDVHRKKWVVLTPEEWVRQNFLQYLLQVQGYPAPLIAVERQLKLGELNKRFDILVYDGSHRPWMMVECKAMEVSLTDETLQQLLRYNMAIPVPYLVITNGTCTVVFERRSGRLEKLRDFPQWSTANEPGR